MSSISSDPQFAGGAGDDRVPPEHFSPGSGGNGGGDSVGQTNATRDPNETIRGIAFGGVVICAFFQVFALAGGDVYFLAAMGGLLAWFFLAGHIAPLYIIFVGNLVVRLGQIARFGRIAFQDSSPEDFLFHLFDSISFVGLIAFAFIHFELAPKRLYSWNSSDSTRRSWHMFEPFSVFLFRMPIAITCALLVYFISGQIQSPLPGPVLAEKFAQTYIVVISLFAAFLLVKTLFDLWSWRMMNPEQARFYIRNQIGSEMGSELDDLRKPAWSRIDHASAVGGMFLVQWIIAMFMSAIMIINARISGNVFMWPAVAALFVFLTAFYNAIRTARSNVAGEQHIITIVGFAVVIVVGFQTTNLPVWPWRMLFYTWWCFNALIILRMSYLWLLDEHFARKNGWESARPASLMRTILICIEGTIALVILYVVSVEMLTHIMYGG